MKSTDINRTTAKFARHSLGLHGVKQSASQQPVTEHILEPAERLSYAAVAFLQCDDLLTYLLN